MYSTNPQNIPPVGTIKNSKDEISEFYQSLFDANISSEYKHEIKNLSNCGDLAIEVGQFSVDWVRNDSSQWTFKANSMTHWEKNENGEWKIKNFLYNIQETE